MSSGDDTSTAPEPAVARLARRKAEAEERRRAVLEEKAERTLEALDMLDTFAEQHGRWTVPSLPPKDGAPDPRDPSLVFAESLADFTSAELATGFAELDKAARKWGGKVALVPTGAGLFVVRFPGDTHYKRFRNLFQRDATKAESLEVMALASSVYPGPAEVASLLRSNSVIAEKLTDRAIDLGGVAHDPK